MSLTLRDASGAEIGCTWWAQCMPVDRPQPVNGHVCSLYNGLRVAEHTSQSQARTTHVQSIYIHCESVSVLEELVDADADFPPFIRGQALAPRELPAKGIGDHYEVIAKVVKVDPVQQHRNLCCDKVSQKQVVHLDDSSGISVPCTVYKTSGFPPFEVEQVVSMREVSLIKVRAGEIHLSVLAGHTARNLCTEREVELGQ